MTELIKGFYKNKKTTLITASVLVLATALAASGTLYWQFWLFFDLFLYLILVVYFVRGYLGLLNIHLIAVTLIMLYALPSIISILNGTIAVDNHQFMVLLSSIGIGLIGYFTGVIVFKGLFPYREMEVSLLSQEANTLFWLAYKYRWILALISIMLFLQKGFMSYSESIVYRMQTTGFADFTRALPTLVFSVLLVAIISIVGDMNKRKKLSLLSYILIALVVFSTISSNTRTWIITLGACLAVSIFFYAKKKIKPKHILLIFLAAVLVYGIVVAIPWARSGTSVVENLKNFPQYFLSPRVLNIMNVGEFGSFESFITLVKNIPDNMGFHFDAYINDFQLLIPTTLYSHRPLPPAKWYTLTFFPGAYSRGLGMGFYVIGFGYLFAGPIGVLIHLFLFGLLFEALNRFFRKTGVAGIFFYSYFFTSLFTFARADGFFVFIKNALLMYLFIPVALLAIFVIILYLVNRTVVRAVEPA
jgi:oligosaccharide repeat unit polymerase